MGQLKNIKSTNIKELIQKGLYYCLISIAICYIIIFFILVIFRLQYPFELEWMEGGSVDHVRRILSGRSIYIQPKLEFVPFIYTPLYYYLAAFISIILGIGFFPLRLVSLFFSITIFLIIFKIVYRETENPIAGFLASSLFIASSLSN